MMLVCVIFITSTTQRGIIMTLEQIKDSVDRGVKTNWKNYMYEVIKGTGERSNDYFVRCIDNDSIIGLTHRDGVTMNGDAEDFYNEDER